MSESLIFLALKRASRLQLVRGAAFILAAVASSCASSCALLGRWPAISPFLSISSAIAARRVAVLTFFCLPLILLSLFKGRWFCNWLCPAGFLFRSAGRLGRAGLSRAAPQLARPLLAIALGGAVFGLPLFLLLDPLSLFNGFFGSPGSRGSAPFGLGFGAVLILSAVAPGLWCSKICPLGATFDLIRSSFRRVKRLALKLLGPTEAGSEGLISDWACRRQGRRSFLFLMAGAAVAVALRSIRKTNVSGVLRPPGALEESKFVVLCARCGSCARACPERIIVPDMGESGLAGFLTPKLTFDKSYCNEWCNECGKACPTAAIRNLPLELKRETVLGTASIDKQTCLAWAFGNYCMVCHEFCPYQAVEIVLNDGVNCPVVDENACRGCGACESQCPAIPSKAIVVRGLRRSLLSPCSRGGARVS